MTGRNYTSKPSFLQRNFHHLLFIVLLLIAASLRFWGFFLPSNIGDSVGYQSLAMKMNDGFMRHYNVFHYKIVQRNETGIVDYLWENDPQKWNSQRIRKIYHVPLHLQPPLYPILLWGSHEIFNRGEPYSSVGKNLGWKVVRAPPWSFFHAQFYAVLPGFLASLSIVLLVYLFCLRFFFWKEGLLAATLMAAAPLEIAISAKVYSDGVLSLFTFAALFAYLLSLKQSGVKAVFYAILSGICLGFAYLTKVTGVLFGAGIFLATLLNPSEKNSIRKLFQWRLWLCAGLTLAVASPWLWSMYQTYGKFLVNTPQDSNNPWYQYVFSRPAFAYFTDLIYFVPTFILGWIRGLWTLFRGRKYFLEIVLWATSLFYAFAFVLFKFTGTAGVEDRYLIPIYPALTILTARFLTVVIEKFASRRLQIAAWTFVIIVFCLLGFHSAQIGLGASMVGLTVFKPFWF